MSHEDTNAAFDRIVEEGDADRYEEDHRDVVEQVLEALGIGPGERVLDLGCGNGWATRLIAQANAGVQAIGVDNSPRMIARADELHSYTIRARYDSCPFEALDFKDEEFTRVFSMESLYYAQDLDKALSEVHRTLKPGGQVDIVINYFADSPATEIWAAVMGIPMQRLSAQEWRAAFERAGFTDVITERLQDRRGPGDESEFQPSDACPDYATRLAQHAAGSLWLRASKAS